MVDMDGSWIPSLWQYSPKRGCILSLPILGWLFLNSSMNLRTLSSHSLTLFFLGFLDLGLRDSNLPLLCLNVLFHSKRVDLLWGKASSVAHRPCFSQNPRTLSLCFALDVNIPHLKPSLQIIASPLILYPNLCICIISNSHQSPECVWTYAY